MNPRRILVVDENLTTLHFMREILEQDGHWVSTAESGQAALDRLSGSDPIPDLVFMSHHLPDMPGMQVLQVYRLGRTRPAPVYFLGSDLSAGELAQLRENGAAGVIAKPLRPDEIRHALVEALGDTPSRENLPRFRQDQRQLRAVPLVYVDKRALAELAAASTRPEFLNEVLDLAIADIERTSTVLASAITDARWGEARTLANDMKSVADHIGAFRLKHLVNSFIETEMPDREEARAKFCSELASTTANSLAALRHARVAPQDPA